VRTQRRHCGWSRNNILFVVLKFVIIDWRLRNFLLLFLEPAEAKEENVWSFSIVYTNNIGLEMTRSEPTKPTRLQKTNVCSLSEWNIDSARSVSL
jgi:hypothetical protein